MININIQPLIVNLSMEEEIEYLMCEVSEFIEALEKGSNSEAISEMYDVCQIMQGLLTQYKKCNRYEIEVGNTIHQHKIDKYIEEKKHDFKYNTDI